MADIGKVIFNLLSNDGTIAGYVSSRIYPDTAPQGTVFPFIVYAEISTTPTDTKEGASPLDVKRVQIDYYSNNRDTTQAIAERARTLLDRYSATNNGVQVDKVIFRDEQTGDYDPEINVFWRSQDYEIRIKR